MDAKINKKWIITKKIRNLLFDKKAPPCIGRGFLWILEAADDTERGEQGRESGNNHLDDCLDDVLFHSIK